MSCLRFALGELIGMADATISGVTSIYIIITIVLPIVLVSIVTVVWVAFIWVTSATTISLCVVFPTIVIVHWLASYIIDTIAVKVEWMVFRSAGLCFPLYFWHTFVIVEIVNVSENLHKSQTVGVASVCADFGTWARFL